MSDRLQRLHWASGTEDEVRNGTWSSVISTSFQATLDAAPKGHLIMGVSPRSWEVREIWAVLLDPIPSPVFLEGGLDGEVMQCLRDIEHLGSTFSASFLLEDERSASSGMTRLADRLQRLLPEEEALSVLDHVSRFRRPDVQAVQLDLPEGRSVLIRSGGRGRAPERLHVHLVQDPLPDSDLTP